MNEVGLEKNKERVQADKDFTSDRISELSRYISFGALAAIFVLLTSESLLWQKLKTDYKWLSFSCAASGIAAIFLDYFQYVFGYFASRKASKGKKPTYKYDTSWCIYKLRYLCFFGKQVMSSISGLTLVVAVFLGLIG